MAISLNAHHGRNLTAYDRTHCIAKALAADITPAEIATLLNITTEKVTSYKVDRCVRIEHTRKVVPVKRPIRHLTGQEVTQEQADVIPSLGGNTQGFYVVQLCKLIKLNMIDTGDEKLMEQLEELHELLKGFFAKQMA